MDWVISFPDNDRKPPFSVIFWPLVGLNLSKVVQKQIYSHKYMNTYTESVYNKFKMDGLNVFHNGQKPSETTTFSHFWPLEGRNWANVAPKQISSEHSLNKYIHEVWNELSSYFSLKWSETAGPCQRTCMKKSLGFPARLGHFSSLNRSMIIYRGITPSVPYTPTSSPWLRMAKAKQSASEWFCLATVEKTLKPFILLWPGDIMWQHNYMPNGVDNIGWSIGLMPDATKPLPELIINQFPWHMHQKAISLKMIHYSICNMN